MDYDIFISYTISESSVAYEMSTALSRSGKVCHLDCVDSNIALNAYVENALKSCKVFAILWGDRYWDSDYAHKLVEMATSINKVLFVCKLGTRFLPDVICNNAKGTNIINIQECSIEDVIKNRLIPLLVENQAPHNIKEEKMESPTSPKGHEQKELNEKKGQQIQEVLHSLIDHSKNEANTTHSVKPQAPQIEITKTEEESTWYNKLISGILSALVTIFLVA